MSSEPADLGLLEAAAALRGRQLSSAELTESCLQRIEADNGGEPDFDGAPDRINAFIRLYPELARERAAAADARLAADADGAPLVCGIPLAVKDLYGIAGLPLTASSRVLDGNIADADAVAWARLSEAGMVPLGHTHTHEFAAGGTTDQVGNPHDLSKVAGGSSGGSAAALAARMAPAALGSDTCGSLRIPAACCGTSAIKPTHGTVPIDGIVPMAPSLDHAGPMARTVADCAALLQAMAVGGAPGAPFTPPTTLAELPIAASAGPRPLAGLTIALTDRTDSPPLSTEVASGFDRAIAACRELGARIVSLPSPWTVDWGNLSAVLLTEVWAYHRRFAERHDHYRPSIAEFVEAAANFTDAPAYLEAQARRVAGTAAWSEWFSTNAVDLVLEPTLPILPYDRGPGYDRGHTGGSGDPMIALTAMWDMTGMPVAALPVSWNVGVSLIALGGDEPRLVQAAIDLQEHALGIPDRPLQRQ